MTVIVSVGSLYMGMAAANAQQDRETMRRHKGIARALLADLQRINDDLDAGVQAESNPHHTGVVVPAIHPWVEGLLTQIADVAPAVIEGYMSLQRILVQVGEARGRVGSWRDGLWSAGLENEREMGDARRDYQLGEYDPLANRHVPPTVTVPPVDIGPDDEIPRGLDQLLHVFAVKQREARRRTRYNEEGLATAVAEAIACENLLRRQLRSLRGVLVPIADRKIPTVPALAWRTTIPMPEDADADRAEEQAALRRAVGQITQAKR